MRSVEERRLEALERANVVRGQVSELRCEIAAGGLSVHDVLLGRIPVELAAGARVIRVEQALRSVPSVGPGAASRACARARVNASSRLGDLSPSRRRELLAALLFVRPSLVETGAIDA